MAVEYAIIIKTREGIVLRVLTGQSGGFRWLSYQKELNHVGLLIFDLDGGHESIDILEWDAQVEVWRMDKDAGLSAYCDFEALYVDNERSAPDSGNSSFRAICPGQMDFLARAVVAWPANTEDRSYFEEIKASTIMTNLVTYNATSSATTGNGRLRTTDLANISVEADDDDGEVMTFACAQQPLLEALQDVARIGNRDFWLERTGAQAWTFRTDNYLGDDRSSTVTFALNYGNMSNPILRRNRLNEKTVAIVGGQGTDDDRDYVVRTGDNYDAVYNSKEAFHSATSYTTTGGLQAAGDIRLDELRALDDLTWETIQTPGCMYGVHYFLGDLIKGVFEDVTATKQIASANVTFAPGHDRAETIQVTTIYV